MRLANKVEKLLRVQKTLESKLKEYRNMEKLWNLKQPQ